MTMKVILEIHDNYSGALSVTAIKSDVLQTRISATVISLSDCNNIVLKENGTWEKTLEVKDGN